MSSFQKFIANVGWTVLGRIGVQIILFAISIFLTRYLGKERLGDYATLLVIPIFIRMLNSFGLETLINKNLPELNVKDSSGTQGKYLISRLLILRGLTTLGFCFLIYYFLPNYFDFLHNQRLIEFRWAIIFYFIALTIESIFNTLFMTLLRFKTLAKTEILGALMNLGFLILFIRMDYGIYAVLYAYILATGITILIYLILARKEYLGPVKKPDWEDMGGVAWMSYGINLFGFGLMTQSDVLLMNFFQVSRGDVGLYHLATALGGTLAFLIAGVAPMAFSLFSETYTKDGLESLGSLYCQIVGFACYLTVPIFVFCAFNATHIIHFIYGSSFAEGSAALITYAAFAGIQTALGINFTVTALFVINLRKVALRSTVEGSVLNIGLNLILIPAFGMMGAITATGIVMVYMVLRQLKVLMTKMEISSVFPFIGKCFLYCLIASIPSQILSWLGMGHVITNLLLYLTALPAILIYLKPFNNEQRQFLISVYPKLENGSKLLFRAPGK